ncbi:MAG: acetylornithine deacetylase [Gammaproteobacteria bacterium]|nr:acetylornithine deacetylase [Gammaproteobacteria bacterium]
MNKLLTQTLDHLAALVRCDTRNPPRLTNESGINAYLAQQLHDFEISIADLGEGSVNLLAVRGKPDTLFNFHIDTVPDSPAWSGNPFTLKVDDQKATGLGACDIKGAAACMLTAAANSSGDLALLFSSDEEAGNSQCITQFLKNPHKFRQVVVAEPTGARAVLAHRGIASAQIEFNGVAGHSSSARAMQDNAVHRAASWLVKALDFAQQQQKQVCETLSGIRFNAGRFEGGIKPNMIAPDALIRFGLRPLPGQNAEELLSALRQLAATNEVKSFAASFVAPSLPARTEQLAQARALASALDLPIADAVDFWTEAALFSAAGLTALVYGPGDIAQAHCADEWVALSQLTEVTETYLRLSQ